jgi:hypothetical protein
MFHCGEAEEKTVKGFYGGGVGEGTCE